MENIANYLNNISVGTYVVIFLGGVAASFTPCVYPLLPIIIGVIGATKERARIRNFILSLSYVIGMAITFSTLGVFAAMTGRLFGQIQSSPLAHIIVGNIMLVLGLALMDVITLPTFLLSRVGAGKVIEGSSILSVFFMGVASGFVALPCTVAILGALLTYVATTQNVVFGFSLLFTFAMGLGTLLILIGTFTGILKAMQKSDRLMHIIQKGLAFLLILLGEYFIFRAGFLSI